MLKTASVSFPRFGGVHSMIIWFVVYLPLRKMMEFVSWDEIPNIWKNKIHVPNMYMYMYICKCISGLIIIH